ncbi:hypothetical protein [Alteromonas sp. C1M14]|uniref:hypothetical protein n=1 Tax=Alteromonas sp. C1M14 TaxID=2841567 RepID=UPI001C09B097|nr:hypothetical protein [Alteromonas sp. C1M14]MBU2976863.1 hypothetical protein [Alteromonas sp. C1M14]
MRLKTTLQKYLLPALILIVAAGVYVAQKMSTQSRGNPHSSTQCHFDDLSCELAVGTTSLKATFSTIPEAEETITVQFSLDPQYEIESVWIEGINMYMGKIPVLVEEMSPGQWSGWFMLGSCSEPQMQWQMLMHIKGLADPKIFTFTTDTH